MLYSEKVRLLQTLRPELDEETVRLSLDLHAKAERVTVYDLITLALRAAAEGRKLPWEK
jgi:hypothetical protein